MKKYEKIHPRLPELTEQMNDGRLSRREFIRYAALLGVSVGCASGIAGLVSPKPAHAAATVQRGGILKISVPVQKIIHVTQINSIGPSNILRQVAEYLTLTDGKNITHPYLLENWQASQDLKTWTLNLRKGIKFNNGDEFTADDVVFTMGLWLNKDLGSSFLGMMGGYLNSNGIEKVNKYQVKLHLKLPEIAVPEHLFHYPGLMMNHRTFEGNFLKNPVGTGPYTIDVYKEGQICKLKARKDYWQKGADGQSLPYLDGINFIDIGTETSPQISALASADVDLIDLGDASGIEVYGALKNNPKIKIKPVSTAQLRVMRMRVDTKTYDDNRVRMALKLCQNREKCLALAYQNQGLPGQDVHCYEGHPDYCPIATPKYDPEKAKALLTEAGYANGLDISIAVATEWNDVVRFAEILKQDSAPAGFRLNINTMPVSQYWDQWTEVPLGVTDWQHRPLGTMVFNLAYVADEDGKPVPWNETRWVDEEFSTLLKQANATLDVIERRKIMCKLEMIQQTRGSIGIPYSRNTWSVCRKKVHGVKPHPTNYMLFNEVWKEV